MRILNAHSLTAAGRIPPETAELNLSERDSALVITAGPEAPELSVGQWLQDDTDPGAGIVWRVRTADENASAGTRTYTLEHLIRSLADRILPNEVKSAAMGGTAAGCTARQAITYVLGLQGDWILGEFDYNSVSNPYQFSGETLLAAIETVSASLEDPVWSYDFTTYPFRLNITRESSAAACEMRAGRNIATLRKTVDRSRLYTRLYPVGKNNLKLNSPGYVEQNKDLWGLVERTETDQSKRTRAQLEAWARARLARHCNPVVTVQISGADLSAATGEPLDRLVIGRKCRIPLPDLGVVILEKITKLSYRDKVRDPESVTVTLANNPEDVQSIIRQDRAGGGGARRTDAEVNEENMLVIGDVESGLYTRITQTASELRREAHDEAESMRTFVTQTASQMLQTAENDVESLRTVVQQTASAIRSEAADQAESLRTLVQQTASSWAANLEQVAGSDGRVTAASIALAINQSTGETEAKIDANRVYIGNARSTTVISGKAELTDLQAANAKIEAVTVVEGSARYIQSGKVYATSSLSVGYGSGGGGGTFYFRGESYQKTNVVIKNEGGGIVAEGSCLGTGGTNSPINLSHYHKITVEEGTGTLAGKMVVTLGAAQSTEGSANFNIADTQVYKDGVAAARAGVWLYYVQQAGSDHQGTLTANSYIALGWDDENGQRVYSDATWLTPAAAPSGITISNPSWAHTPTSGIAYNNNTATFYTQGQSPEANKQLHLEMDQTAWDSGSKVVYVSHTSAARANSVAQLNVSIGSFSYGSMGSGSSGTTSTVHKEYSVSKGNNYCWFTVTVAGVTRRIQIHMLS